MLQGARVGVEGLGGLLRPTAQLIFLNNSLLICESFDLGLFLFFVPWSYTMPIDSAVTRDLKIPQRATATAVAVFGPSITVEATIEDDLLILHFLSTLPASATLGVLRVSF